MDLHLLSAGSRGLMNRTNVFCDKCGEKAEEIPISFHLIVGEIMSGCVKIVIGGVNDLRTR